MTAIILNGHRQVFHSSPYRPLTPDEILDRDGSDAQEQFVARVYERLEFQVLPRELKNIWLENIPHHDSYKNET